VIKQEVTGGDVGEQKKTVTGQGGKTTHELKIQQRKQKKKTLKMEGNSWLGSSVVTEPKQKPVGIWGLKKKSSRPDDQTKSRF